MHLFKNLFRSRKFGRNSEQAPPGSKQEIASPIAKRLADEFALLQELEFKRNLRADPHYGRATEDRIIWRELFDLELQEVDERISHHSSE